MMNSTQFDLRAMGLRRKSLLTTVNFTKTCELGRDIVEKV